MAQVQIPGQPDREVVAEPVPAAIALDINGEGFRHTGDPAMPLLWYLREVLQITGTKYADADGAIGYDLVLVDGKAQSAITLPMGELAGRSVTTVEGLAAADGRLHPLQQAFIDEDAIGCGYCTAGWLIASADLLRRHPKPNDGDIDTLPVRCRCGVQTRVRKAIKRASGASA
jgi:isoquinoline 1-oxidoreductase alpha subunit